MCRCHYETVATDRGTKWEWEECPECLEKRLDEESQERFEPCLCPMCGAAIVDDDGVVCAECAMEGAGVAA